MQKKIWFCAKTYGWGWTPCSWEGWLVTVGSIVVILGIGFLTKTNIALFIGLTLLAVGILIWICVKKGEKPRWRWGK